MTKIKAIIFDLDNVLIDSRHLHYEAFKESLLKVAGIEISWQEHNEKYDGLTTKKKLEIMKIDGPVANQISSLKQNLTKVYLPKYIYPSARIMTLLVILRSRGYKIACASNSVRYSVIESLTLLGVNDLFDSILSSEDVNEPKPSPEIYIKTMAHLNVHPHETLILEDSPCGIAAAHESGANVLTVINPTDVTLEKIEKMISLIEITHALK